MARKLGVWFTTLIVVVLGILAFYAIYNQVASVTHDVWSTAIYLLSGVYIMLHLFWVKMGRALEIITWAFLSIWLVAGIWMGWIYANAYVRDANAVLPAGVPVSQVVIIIACTPAFLILMTLIYARVAAYRRRMDTRTQQVQVAAPPEQQI